MFTENLKLFFKFYARPLAALSDSIDRGNLLFAGLLVTGVAFLMALTVTNRLYETYEAVPIPAEERLPKELRVPPQVRKTLRSSIPLRIRAHSSPTSQSRNSCSRTSLGGFTETHCFNRTPSS